MDPARNGQQSLPSWTQEIPNGYLSNDCCHYQRSWSTAHIQPVAAEIYQKYQYVIENGDTKDGMRNILERIRRLAVYQFGTGKELDKDAQDLTTKELWLPDSLRYLEYDEEEEKDYFFSLEVVEKIQQTRFEESVIRGATNNKDTKNK